MEPEILLASPETYERIEKICQRRCHDENEALECTVFVMDGLKKENYARLRAFGGRSSPNTYLYTVVNSLVFDFIRHKYGRKRIPETVRRLGAWAEAVYRFVCWKKFSFDDAYFLIRDRGLFAGNYDEYDEKVQPVREAPCRKNPVFASTHDGFDDEDKPGLPDPEQDNPFEHLLRKLDHERRLEAAAIIRKNTEEFSEDDQMLVRLVYGSGLSTAAAGRSIGIQPGAARKCLKRLQSNLHEKLLAAGIRES